MSTTSIQNSPALYKADDQFQAQRENLEYLQGEIIEGIKNSDPAIDQDDDLPFIYMFGLTITATDYENADAYLIEGYPETMTAKEIIAALIGARVVLKKAA